MLVTLIGKKNIHKIILPSNPIGNYWITDKTSGVEKKLVNIEGKEGNWQIITNKNVKAINPKALEIKKNGIRITSNDEIATDRVILKENYMYGIFIDSIDNFYIVYCSPVYENYAYHMDIKGPNGMTEIFVGKSNKNEILYNNALVSDIHCRLFKKDEKWHIENYDKKFGTYVNNELVYDEAKIINNGDIIFIMGLKIVLIGDSIYINNPLDNVKLNLDYFENSKEKIETISSYENEDFDSIELYNESEYFYRIPRLKKVQRS